MRRLTTKFHSHEESHKLERTKQSENPSLAGPICPPVTLRDILKSPTPTGFRTISGHHSCSGARRDRHREAVASSDTDNSRSWYFVPRDVDRPAEAGRWLFNSLGSSPVVEGTAPIQCREGVEKRLHDEVTESRPTRPSLLLRHSASQVQETMSQMTLDSVLNSISASPAPPSPTPTAPRPQWTWPPYKVLLAATTTSLLGLSGYDIVDMMNTGELIEDSKGIRYSSATIENSYVLLDLGKGKKEDDSSNVRLDRLWDHSWNTLRRVNIEGEEEVQRAGSPIIGRDDEKGWERDVAERGGPSRARKEIRFWAWKRAVRLDGKLELEVVVDNAKMRGEKGSARGAGQKARERKLKKVAKVEKKKREANLREMEESGTGYPDLERGGHGGNSEVEPQR
ncbi:hypothetical protein K458DRAFT_137698 [Lentithecium fluviatile CBS 122367]|uniref:Uncharacterized protein n=1 Tax=Lentithecium fluviatile CBS 122367 TaxID=1168545 RepID=A0A6G1IK49_9PLEO|nr:hypothetical protein K458DRAFT_137698 [Lentithecium fluviatile CBS 122367]